MEMIVNDLGRMWEAASLAKFKVQVSEPWLYNYIWTKEQLHA